MGSLEATRGFVELAKCRAAVNPIKKSLTFVRDEATRGFEPLMRVLQTLALPLGHVA
jgi:hypothetical protein